MDSKNSLKKIKLFLFDMDGTLYVGDNLFPFTIGLLETLRRKNIRYIFLTNNSSKSVKDYILKLKNLGINSEYDDFLTSSQAAAVYLNAGFKDKKLYVCGTESLKEELRRGGFEITDKTDEAQCIVMGNDQELTFKKLYDVSKLLLTKEDIPYVATNPDYVCPTEFGSVPDCGSICDMLYNVSKRKPVFIGKPEPMMVRLAAEKSGCCIKNTAVVGDRIYTDVKCGLNAGALSVLVMSGETTQEILEKSSDKPDVVLQNAGEILNYI